MIRLLIFTLFISLKSFCQKDYKNQLIGSKSPHSITLSKFKKEVDSLSNVYKLRIVGYTKTIIDDRESMLLICRYPSGDIEHILIYTRKLEE